MTDFQIKSNHKMADLRIKVRCKYQNFGYCKYQNNCKYLHNNKIYLTTQCKEKSCLKKQPKVCRYKEKCRRGPNCLYRHDKTFESKEMSELKSQNKKLLKEIEVLELRLKETENIELEFTNNLKSSQDVVKSFERSAETVIVENKSLKIEIETQEDCQLNKKH